MKYSEILKANNVRLPAALIDLEAFDQNLRVLANSVKGLPFTIRVATKSIRVPELIQRILKSGAPYKGLMCFSADEVDFLAQQGFDDFLLAYPTVSGREINLLLKNHFSGKKVMLVCDDIRQINQIISCIQNSADFKSAANSRPFSILLEVDMSVRFFGVVLGVRRSPLRDIKKIIELIQKIKSTQGLEFNGFMAYEAQVAGVGDKNPFKKLINFFTRPFRKISMKSVIKKRHDLMAACRAHNIQVNVFNGGGTGSTYWHGAESGVLTEVTAGSGFICSHLFSYYSNVQLQSAGFFALQIVRQAESNWHTCSGGGYVASGEPGPDRLPQPWSENNLYSKTLHLSALEGCGEVQTPVFSSEKKELGDLMLFRPAKAGEWLERFNEVHLFDQRAGSNLQKLKTVKTYRGHGECYF